MKISEKIQKCDLSPMRKFHPYAVKAENAGRKIYHLNIGQPDIKTPEMYFDAVHEFHKPTLAYAPSPGLPVMVKAVQDYYEKIGVGLKEEDILITTGGSEALQILMNVILDPGSEVLVPEPFYPNYNTMITLAGGVIHPIPTTPEEGYRYAKREKIEACINENTRAIMVTNPGNPTGLVLSREEMRVIADVAKAHDLYIIGDEVYREFVYGDEPLASMAQLEDVQKNVVLIDSVSKRFSACGARVGALISKNRDVMSQAMKMAQCRLSVATLDQVASAKLYECGPEYFAVVREEYKKRRDTCHEMIRKIPGVVCAEPQGAFYLMAALPVDDVEKFQIWLLEEFEDKGETVMFAPGGGFYKTNGKGNNEIRIAYVLKQEDLIRAMELLAMGIEAYNKKQAEISGAGKGESLYENCSA